MYHHLVAVLFVATCFVAGVSSTFSSSVANTQLTLSYAAYCPAAKISAWNCKWCTVSGFVVHDVIDDSLTSTQVYVGYQGSTVVVAFRGSTDITNWILNLEVFTPINYPTSVSGAQVHGGFYASYIAVSATLLTKVNALISSIHATGIIFTGHSLGGALATLASVDFHTHLSIPITSYTFGSPRVGNTAFATYYDSILPNTYRSTFKDDIVVHLPPTSMQSFHHVAQEIWWSSSTSYKTCNLSGEDSSCSNSVFALLYSTADHTDYLGISLGSCT